MIGLLLAIAIMATENIIELRPQPGPQTAFLATSADIAIYGGSAGSGKSYALLLDSLRYMNHPGFKCTIFRRTREQIVKQGAIWDESIDIYSGLATPKVSMLRWEFPTPGVSVAFEHCEHVKDVTNYQGAAFAGLGLDELTHFEESQFWYFLSRNRSKCGVRPYLRATCNPDPSSWVANFISWWIDQETGYPIPERSGVLRYMARLDDQLIWGNSKAEVLEINPRAKVKTVTFIPAKLSDNKILMRIDPGYEASLLAMPEIERRKLLDGNWKQHIGGIIKKENLAWYTVNGESSLSIGGASYEQSQLRRFATIDTAGGSEEKANEAKGENKSYTVVAIWDYHSRSNMLFLRHIWRTRKEYVELEKEIPNVLQTWNCRVVNIENATIAVAIASVLKKNGVRVEFIPTKLPGQNTTGKAKYDRAVASGLLVRIENGWLALPEAPTPWVDAYVKELCAWTGLPKETADQIDVSSYAAYYGPRQTSKWDGAVNVPAGGRVNSTTLGGRR